MVNVPATTQTYEDSTQLQAPPPRRDDHADRSGVRRLHLRAGRGRGGGLLRKQSVRGPRRSPPRVPHGHGDQGPGAPGGQEDRGGGPAGEGRREGRGVAGPHRGNGDGPG